MTLLFTLIGCVYYTCENPNFEDRDSGWEFFDDGLLREARYDDNNDGRPERWEFFSNGRLSELRRDTNLDGDPDQTEEVPRGGRRRRVAVQEHAGPEGDGGVRRGGRGALRGEPNRTSRRGQVARETATRRVLTNDETRREFFFH